jgi:cobalt-zinc-cadmium efflux system outer membrane protein
MDLDVDQSIARGDRARAQALLASFFAGLGDATTLVAVVPDASARPAIPDVDGLAVHAESVLPEPAAFRQEVEAARFADRSAARRLVPEPEIVAGTKSSTFGGGDVGSVFSVHVTVPLFDRARPEHAQAEARRSQAEARLALFQHTLRAQLTALRAAVTERRQAAGRYRAATADAEQLERIAQVSYEAGERGILELLDAYRSSAAARMRQAALDADVRQAELDLELVSGWEIR